MKARFAAVLGLCALGVSVSDAQTYDLVIDEPSSGLAAALGFAADTAGTLVGDWDPDTNSEGTRTKPGLFGGFETDENLPVVLGLGVELEGDLDTATSGAFTLTISIGEGLAEITGLSADLLAGGLASIPATLGIAPESFRTRNPDSVYIGIPIDLPIGDLAVTSLTLTQTGPAAGALVEIVPGHYAFAVAGPAELAGSVELLGSPAEIPPSPFALALAGEILVTGETATITSVQAFDQSQTQNPGQELPEFPLDLPTILPPGETAHVLMNLTLEEVSTSLVGELTLLAEGSLAACAADFNGDGSVDTRDVVAFLNAWAVGDQSADFDANGVIDTRDVIAFLNAWSDGC